MSRYLATYADTPVVSRRSFGKIASLLAAASSLPFSDEMAMAQASRVDAPAGAVMINSNENPLGPCNEGLEALHSIAGSGGRYLFSEGEKVQGILAEQEGLKPDQVRIYPGIERAAASDCAGVLFALRKVL